MRRARHTAALGALLVLGAATAAHATDGPIYAYGPSTWTRPGIAETVHPGPTWLVQAPALNPAGAGDYWRAEWRCPAPGSEITAVQFSALRTQAPSSLAVAVTDARQALWSEGDAGMPQSPSGGRAYQVNLPGGRCEAHLTLTQMEVRAQHARGYFIGDPRALVRDLAPPAVVLRSPPSGWINSGASTARVAWAAADNFGSDGTATQRILVGGGTRWTGAPGVGEHAVDLPLAGYGDGAHRVAVEVDGDGTAGAAAEGVIHIDRTTPMARDLSATPTPGGATLRWSVADNLSGVGASQVQVNADRDGSAAGTWVTVASAAGPGPHATTVPLRLADGVHAWRVVASDGAGNVGTSAAVDRIAVDSTPPALELHGVPSGWLRALDLELTATDNLQGALGLGATQVDVNAATDGGEGGAWITRASAPGPPGHRVVPVDLAGLADGRHLMRVLVRNGGPFGQTLATERRAAIRVDRSPPSLSRVTFTPRADGLTAAWVAADALAGMETATLQVRDEGGWRTLATRRADDEAGRMSADVSSVVRGPRTFRLVAGDAAGNVATAEAQLRLAGRDAFARLRGARLSLAVPGARRSRIGGRRALISRIAIGRTVTMAGLLRDARGRAIAGAEVQARGHRGALVGRALTRRDGRFRLDARPLAGGPLRIGVPAGRDLLPTRAPAVVLEVKPRVSLAASSTSAAPGQPVAFSGRLTPAPADIGLGSRKSVVLEWHDPLRRTWRPVVNARIRSDGTFAIPWSFNLSGLTIPMRVSVPTEVGWPLLPVRSGVIPVVVGDSPAAR